MFSTSTHPRRAPLSTPHSTPSPRYDPKQLLTLQGVISLNLPGFDISRTKVCVYITLGYVFVYIRVCTCVYICVCMCVCYNSPLLGSIPLHTSTNSTYLSYLSFPPPPKAPVLQVEITSFAYYNGSAATQGPNSRLTPSDGTTYFPSQGDYAAGAWGDLIVCACLFFPLSLSVFLPSFPPFYTPPMPHAPQLCLAPSPSSSRCRGWTRRAATRCTRRSRRCIYIYIFMSGCIFGYIWMSSFREGLAAQSHALTLTLTPIPYHTLAPHTFLYPHTP